MGMLKKAHKETAQQLRRGEIESIHFFTQGSATECTETASVRASDDPAGQDAYRAAKTADTGAERRALDCAGHAADYRAQNVDSAVYLFHLVT